LVAEGHELDKQTEDVLDCEADALGPEISAGLNRIGARQFQAAIKKYSKPKN
jgi:hypothetical protein